MVLEVGDVLAITGWFVITGGTNTRQVRTIAEEIEEKVAEAGGPKPLRVEGLDAGQWVLLDYGDFIVHVFLDEAREFYDLERLWRDVPSLDWRRRAVAASAGACSIGSGRRHEPGSAAPVPDETAEIPPAGVRCGRHWARSPSMGRNRRARRRGGLRRRECDVAGLGEVPHPRRGRGLILFRVVVGVQERRLLPEGPADLLARTRRRSTRAPSTRPLHPSGTSCTIPGPSRWIRPARPPGDGTSPTTSARRRARRWSRQDSYWPTKSSEGPVGDRSLARAARCGAKENRTPDLFHAMEALYQLSYSPVGIVHTTGRQRLRKITADRTPGRNATQGVRHRTRTMTGHG